MLNQYMAAQMMGMGGPFLGAAPGVAGFAVPVGPRPPAPLDSLETFMTRLSAVLERSSDNLRVDAPPPPGLAGVEHSSVQCDGCGQNPILRRRFKSLSRVDYDLCEACAASGQHTQHGPFACLEFPIPVLVMQSDAPPPPGAGAPAAFPPPPPDSTARLAQLGGALGAAEALLSRSAPLVSRAGAALRQEQALAGPARLQAQGATLQAAAALNALGALCLELSRMLGGAHFGDRPAAAALWQRGPVAYIHPMGLQPLTHAMPSHAYGMQGGMQGAPGAAFSMMMPPMAMQQQRMAMPMQMPMQAMPPGVGGPPPSAAEAALTQQIVGAVLNSFMAVPGQLPGQPMPPGAPGAVPLGQTSVTLNFVAGPDGVPLPDGSLPASAEAQGMSQMSPMMSLINGMLPVVQQVVGTPTPPGAAPTHPAAAVAQILAQSPALQQALGSALGPQTIHALHSALGQIVASGNDAAAQQAAAGAAQQGAVPPPPPPPQAAPSAAAPSPPSSDAPPARAVPAQGRSPFDLTRAVTGAPRSRPGSSPPAADSPLQNGAAARPAPPPAATPPPPPPQPAPPAPAVQPEATPAAAEPAPVPAVQGGVSLPARPAPSAAPAGLGAGLGGDLPPPRRPRRAPSSAPRTPGSAPRAQPRQAPPPDFDMFAQLLGGGPGGPGGGPPPGLGAMLGAGGPGGGGLGSMMASMASSPAFQQVRFVHCMRLLRCLACVLTPCLCALDGRPNAGLAVGRGRRRRRSRPRRADVVHDGRAGRRRPAARRRCWPAAAPGGGGGALGG